MKATIGRHSYDESGLKDIVLCGVEIRRCTKCGEREVAIPALDGLHRLIARTLVLKHDRLMPKEIRFLRKHLGLTGVDMASHMGVTPETVSRWENDGAKMESPAEKLLRMLVARKEPIEQYERELTQVAVGRRKALKGTASRDPEHGWQLKQVA